MRFWDSSAVVALLLHEATSARVRAVLREDREVIVWRLTGAEVVSALWRRRRTEGLLESARLDAERGLAALEASWVAVDEIAPVDARARRLLGAHALRAADALQLAAALLACDERPALLPFVTLDDRLAEAARREGFRVLPSVPD